MNLKGGGKKERLYMRQAHGGHSEDILIGFSLKTDALLPWPHHRVLAVCTPHRFCP